MLQECHDEDREVDAEGVEKLFRVVRIPFRVAVVTGNLKLRMHVRQCRKAGEARPSACSWVLCCSLLSCKLVSRLLTALTCPLLASDSSWS